MCKKRFSFYCMMLFLLASCNVDEFIDSNEAQSAEVQIADNSVIEYEITPNLETPLKLYKVIGL